MARTVKGSIVHSIPSFHPERMQGGSGGAFGVAGGNPFMIGLWNNATDGSSLVVWDLNAAAMPNSAPPSVPYIQIDFIQGGSQYFPFTGIQMYVQTPQLAGQIIQTSNFTGVNTFSFTLQVDGTGYYQWPHDWPIAVIRPGWSMVVCTDGTATPGYNVSFIWETVSRV